MYRGSRTPSQGHRVRGVRAPAGPLGMGLGGYQEGLYRVLPSHCPEEPTRRPATAGSGPPPWRGWVGSRVGGRTNGGGGHGQDHPAGPVRTLQVPPCPSLSECRLLAKGARFDLNSLKVSQNDEVSPKSAEKASRSPYIQNGLQKSPLEILGFPYIPAFSHKELMGHI